MPRPATDRAESSLKHPRTNRVWLARLLRGPAVAHRVDRRHPLYRLRNLGLVEVSRVGKVGRGYVPTFAAHLTPAARTPAGGSPVTPGLDSALDAAEEVGATLAEQGPHRPMLAQHHPHVDRRGGHARAQAIVAGHSVLCAQFGTDPACPGPGPRPMFDAGVLLLAGGEDGNHGGCERCSGVGVDAGCPECGRDPDDAPLAGGVTTPADVAPTRPREKLCLICGAEGPEPLIHGPRCPLYGREPCGCEKPHAPEPLRVPEMAVTTGGES